MTTIIHRVAPPERGRVYTFRAVATMYYPHLKPETASRYLRRLIHADPYILGDLTDCGYRYNQRRLTPRQIDNIRKHLGDPAEFYDYAILSKRPKLH